MMSWVPRSTCGWHAGHPFHLAWPSFNEKVEGLDGMKKALKAVL